MAFRQITVEFQGLREAERLLDSLAKADKNFLMRRSLRETVRTMKTNIAKKMGGSNGILSFTQKHVKDRIKLKIPKTDYDSATVTVSDKPLGMEHFQGTRVRAKARPQVTSRVRRISTQRDKIQRSFAFRHIRRSGASTVRSGSDIPPSQTLKNTLWKRTKGNKKWVTQWSGRRRKMRPIKRLVGPSVAAIIVNDRRLQNSLVENSSDILLQKTTRNLDKFLAGFIRRR